MKNFILIFLQIYSILTLIAILLFTFVSVTIQDFDNIIDFVYDKINLYF
jgi:hypothetical protein